MAEGGSAHGNGAFSGGLAWRASRAEVTPGVPSAPQPLLRSISKLYCRPFLIFLNLEPISVAFKFVFPMCVFGHFFCITCVC